MCGSVNEMLKKRTSKIFKKSKDVLQRAALKNLKQNRSLKTNIDNLCGHLINGFTAKKCGINIRISIAH